MIRKKIALNIIFLIVIHLISQSQSLDTALGGLVNDPTTNNRSGSANVKYTDNLPLNHTQNFTCENYDLKDNEPLVCHFDYILNCPYQLDIVIAYDDGNREEILEPTQSTSLTFNSNLFDYYFYI